MIATPAEHPFLYCGPLTFAYRAYAAYLAEDIGDYMIATPAEHAAELLRAAAERELALIQARITQTTTTTGGETTYIIAGPPAPGPVSVPSVFGTSPIERAARHCPHCGQPITVADTPAGADEWPPPSGWRERGPLL